MSTKLVASIFKLYSDLSAVGKEYSELEKMENFQTASKPKQELLGSTCQKAVDNKVVDFIRRMKRGETHDRDGRQLSFAVFTSFLITEERQWIKIMTMKRSVSEVLTTFDEAEDDLSTQQGADSDTDTETDSRSDDDSCSDDNSCSANDSCSDDDSSVG